jgi:hypothetical protein
MAGTVIQGEADEEPRGEFLRGLTRVLTAIFGILSIAWAISSLLVYRAEAAFTTSAEDILRGEKFNTEQLNQLKLQLDATPLSSIRPSAWRAIGVIRLRLMEESLMSGKPQPSAADLDDFQKAVNAALAGNPASSLLWLMEYRLQDLPGGNPDRALKFLRMSYLSGPNEGWIAVRRNSIALRVFPLLPPELAEQVLAEFRGLVQSGFYLDAANILAGPGWAFHEKLLNGLAQIDKGSRYRFAKTLESKDLDDATVPGVVDERPSRPF